MASSSTSSLAPRPKPWESTTSNMAGSSALASSSPSYTTPLHTSSTAPPALPDRPGEMSSLATVSSSDQQAQQDQQAQMGQLGQSAYGGGYGAGGVAGGMYGSGMNNYSSPFSRFGTSYGAYGSGGYGGFGSGYGGYGSGGYGGYGGGYGMGGMDPYGQPNPNLSVTSSLQNSTAPAFALLESVLGTISSFTHLLESTYVATHSSFFAMAGLADQFSGLKSYFGQVLGAFSLLRLGRALVRWLRGERGSGGLTGMGSGGGSWAEEWKIGQASGGPRDQGLHLRNGGRGPNGQRPSSKPLILFLLSAVGLPYLMTKLVRLITRIQEQNKLRQQQEMQLQAGQPVAGRMGDLPPKGPITFARTVFPFAASESHELSLKQDEIVAILQRYEGASGGEDRQAGAPGVGKELGWWRGRTRDGRVGWFPGNYVEILRKRETPIPPPTPDGSGSGNPRVESRTDSIGSSV